MSELKKTVMVDGVEMPLVITIARGFGSGGKSIGIDLANKLGIPCYEDQLLRMASDYSGISEQIFAQFEEKMSGKALAKSLAGFPASSKLAKPSDKKFVSDDNLFQIQAEIVRQLAKTESCIIIGKCANNVLKDAPNVVSVFVDADLDFCIENVVSRMHVSETEAERLIYKTDKFRSDYVRYYSNGRGWKDPACYDMILNSSRLGMDKCAEMIENIAKVKFGL